MTSSARSEIPDAPAGPPREREAKGSSINPHDARAIGAPGGSSRVLCGWRQFHDRLREAAIHSALIETPLAILLAEIRGLERGDDVLLSSVVQVLVEHAGPGSAVVRYGQNMLIAILPHTHAQKADAVAEAFQMALPALGRRPGGTALEPIAVAVSGYDPEEPLAQLVERAFAQLHSVDRGRAEARLLGCSDLERVQV